MLRLLAGELIFSALSGSPGGFAGRLRLRCFLPPWFLLGTLRVARRNPRRGAEPTNCLPSQSGRQRARPQQAPVSTFLFAFLQRSGSEVDLHPDMRCSFCSVLFYSGAAKPADAIPSEEEVKELLIECAVRDGFPLTFVESPRLRALFRPEIKIPSANTLKRMIIKRYKEENEQIADQLRTAGSKVSVTLDCWTSPNTKSFMGITAHYIVNGILQSLALACAPLGGKHSGENLREVFVAKCDQFGLFPNLLGVTTDNASNIDKLLDLFAGDCQCRDITFNKQEQHVRCFAHVVNLAVQTFLRELKAGTSGDNGSPDGDAVA